MIYLLEGAEAIEAAALAGGGGGGVGAYLEQTTTFCRNDRLP